MNKISIAIGFLSLAITAAPRIVSAESQETEIPGVTSNISYMRQYGGVLHLGITLTNTTSKEVRAHKALEYSKIILVDAKANKKHFALKDADGHYLGGPMSDWNGGGRWFAQFPPNSDTLVWILFEAVPQGSTVAVQAPLMQQFDKIAVAEAPPPSGQEVGSSERSLRASLVSANRAAEQLKVQVKISNPGKNRIGSRPVAFSDVYALDPQGKRKYPLLKDNEGIYLAQPLSDKNKGGRFFLSKVEPGGQLFLNLIFQAPPDTVRMVDVIIPWFSPFEATAISGEGGAKDSGVAVAGKSLALERVLKDLNADVTAQQIKVNLSADLLFDFDKADIKKEAEPSLEKVVTVLKSYPNSKVMIEGHADGKGSDSYNQPLSEKRAANVAQWLISHAGLTAANVQIKGWGKSKPIAPNTKPDGSDNPEGRAKNRRVEITVNKS